ncbi:hypothetical protein TNCV_277831 [Trichonephila clavipes]|nr:hypothetical protein TNCV_277831 [Trichonephila clavipes]
MLPGHISYPVMTQKLVTPYPILNAKLLSLATNAGVALVEGNLMVESYKLSCTIQSWSFSKRSCVGLWLCGMSC